MKILIATGIFPPQIGGPATYSKLLYDELPARGIEVDVVNFGDFIDKPKLIRHALCFWNLVKKAADADLIYAQDPVSVGLPALLAAQVLRKKFIVKIVGDYAWEQSVQRFGVKDNLDIFSAHYQKYPWQAKVMKKIEKYVADGAKAIITPSNYLKGIIMNWGVGGDKIHVIYNGFEPYVSRTAKSALRKRYGLYGTTLISVGRLVPWKGFEGLIKAMRSIRAEVPDASLIIVGDGPDKNRLLDTAQREGVQDIVKFAGRLDQRTLFEYIRASDIFVLNTEYEGFSHQLLETMALGTPIITTSVGGNPELIETSKSGILIPYNDEKALIQAILEIIRTPSRALAFSKRGKEKVKEFTDERMLAATADFLNSQR